MNEDANCWIDSVIKEHKKQLDNVSKSKNSMTEIDQKSSINNCIFSENDLKISDYGSNTKEKINSNPQNENEKSYQMQNNKKEYSKNSSTLSSSNLYHDDKALVSKLQKKKNKIKQLKESLLVLQRENDGLQAKNTIPIQSNDDIELMKVQLSQYEIRFEESSNQYLYQISLLKNDNDNYQKRLSETEDYINIVNAFFKNITGLVGGIKVNVFDITELTNQLNHIGDFLSQLIKENATLKIKYHKLLEMNTKLVDYDIDNNNNTTNVNNHKVATGDGLTTFQSLSYVDNVFELNKDKDKRDQQTDYANDHLIKLKQYHQGGDNSNYNAQSPMITVDIYKTLEQRVNMLEKELNMQKQSSGGNNSTNSYHNNHTSSSNNNNKMISIQTDHITTNQRSKSSSKMDGSNTNTNGSNNNNNCNIPVMDKPPKKITKKKKKAKNEGKTSLSHKVSNIVTTNNQRSVTPINSKKSSCSGVTVTKVKSK